MNQQNRNMLEGPLFPNIIRYTVPIILTSLLQLLFNAADLVVVGRFCGSVSVAAVGATGAITNLMINFFIGLSVGVGVAVAHGLGSREERVVHCTVHTALPTALISGAFLTVFGIAFSETFLKLMGTPDSVLPLSAVYMRIIFGGITFNMVYNFCASILRAAGDTKSPLIFLMFAGTLNVILNVIFVTQFHMNVAGVALATIISQGLSAVLVVIALMRRTDSCRLQLNKMRFYKPQLEKIIRIGLPAGIQSSLFSISNVLIQSSVNSFGDVFMSGNAAAGNIEGFVYVCLNAFQQTAVNFAGQNAGARQYRRAVHLHYRFPGGHFLRPDPAGLYLPALFFVRTDGCDHRRAAGHGGLLCPNADLHSGRVRYAHRLDFYHFPDSEVPYAPVPLLLLYGLLDRNLPVPAGGISHRVPETSKRNCLIPSLLQSYGFGAGFLNRC